ncbi:MAG: hypothetical protein ACU0B9_11000 [Limimaricola soesokkakensis]|uniref:hypothetical protein n=1 Tax=Limimaricola TaxID=2211638 RepID=UPI002AC8AF8E|nr:hypothetical protein [Limimaricola variabilis]WPY96895.1 hypothetical protein T8T21_19590 [Limimaricola variabilis]
MRTATISQAHQPPDLKHKAATLDEELSAMRRKRSRALRVAQGCDHVRLTHDIEFTFPTRGIRRERLSDTIAGHIPDGPEPKAPGVDQPANGMGCFKVWLSPAAAAEAHTLRNGAAQMSI